MKATIDVIREALLQPIPCPNCSGTKPCRCLVRDRADQRLNARAANVEAALIEAGLLASPQPASEPTGAQMEEVARFLAKESRFVRYYDENDPDDAGWKVLLTSSHDVETAYAKAKARNEGASKPVTDGLWQAQRVLLDWTEQRRAAEDGV